MLNCRFESFVAPVRHLFERLAQQLRMCWMESKAAADEIRARYAPEFGMQHVRPLASGCSYRPLVRSIHLILSSFLPT